MIDRPELFAYLEQGATIITPNNRLAGELLHFFLNSKNKTVNEKPHCLPYQQYLQNIFKMHGYQNPQSTFPILLTTQQFRYLWAELITQPESQSLNQGLIEEVQEAWSRCQRWQLDRTHPSFFYTPQTRQFQEWAELLQCKLDQLSAIAEDQLVPFFLEQQTPIKPTTIIWYCFDDYTPQQQALQHYLIDRGCSLIHLDLHTFPKLDLASNSFLYAAQDEEDEYKQLTHWINERLSQGEKRIGIVVPDLQNQAERLQRHLQQQVSETFFNISLGQSLSDFPIVSHALSWLHLNGETLSNPEARLLLCSPFLAHSQTEMLERMQSLQECGALQEATIQQSLFVTELQRSTPKLIQRLKALVQYPEHATVSQWITLFIQRLKLLGFPGEYPLNSPTYQCYHRFLTLFDEFRELGFLSLTMSQEKALQTFETLVETTIFQPKTTSSATIWISGLLEASGCIFDSLWVSSMTDECLPQKTKLSAFIPPDLQREKLLPHASPARELLLSAKIIKRLKNSSQNCVFSYTRLTKDKPNLPSPLLIDLPLMAALPSEIHVTASFLENYSDDYQLVFSPDEKVLGGTALLANQAKCPFRAFVSHRLHVKKSIAISDGPNASERGQITHKIMEILWQTLKNQQTLLAMPTDELNILIKSAIETALLPYKRLRKHSFSTPIQVVELKRLHRLVQACLEWDKQRPSFEVEALEQAFTHTLAGINFNLRVDRLDKVEQGKKWVIDYKSTLPTSLPWREDRPKEPQLLLYALLDDTISALLFTGLKEGQASCKGFSAEPIDLTGINALKKGESWADYRENWQKQLTELANEYMQGYCPPQPSSPSVCQQCDYQSLCRFTKEV